MRRILLTCAVLGMVALTARRVRARDPGEVSVGGSYGEHEAHVTCGPDVRVRNVDVGAHWHQQLLLEGARHGPSVDLRGGAGRVSIARIHDATGPAADARLVGGGQLLLGWDWSRFGFGLGGGIFSTAEGAYAGAGTQSILLPSLDLRVTTFDGSVDVAFGIGAPRVPVVARKWGLHGEVVGKARRWEVAVGGYAPLWGDLEHSLGTYVRIGAPVGPVRVDLLDAVEVFAWDRRLGYRFGAGVTIPFR